MSPEQIFKTLEIIADDIVVPVSNAKIAAAIVYKGEIVSIGVNSLKSDPMQARFAKNEHAIYLHAEIAALKRALKRLSREEVGRAEIYIVRRKKANGEVCNGLAKPCVGCQRALDSYGIRKVFYST